MTRPAASERVRAPDMGSTGTAWEDAIPVDGSRQGSKSGRVTGSPVDAITVGSGKGRANADQPVAEPDAHRRRAMPGIVTNAADVLVGSIVVGVGKPSGAARVGFATEVEDVVLNELALKIFHVGCVSLGHDRDVYLVLGGYLTGRPKHGPRRDRGPCPNERSGYPMRNRLMSADASSRRSRRRE